MTSPSPPPRSFVSPDQLRQTYLLQPATLAQVATRGEFQRPPHIRYISRAVSEMLHRPLRMTISMPPRHGKTTAIGEWTSIWRIIRQPSARVVYASYGLSLSRDWSVRVRNWIRRIGGDYGVELQAGQTGAMYWRTTAGGGMLSASPDSTLTGLGADLFIVDDLFDGSADAHNDRKREAVWNWFLSDALSRMEPQASMLLVGTRWHETDLIGRVLNPAYNPLHHQWEELRFPALAERDDVLGRREGEALWPERYDEAALADILLERGSYYFSSQYQQRPSPPEGGILQRSWFPRLPGANLPPEYDARMRVWDLAATAAGTDSRDPDYTVGALVGIKDGRYYLLDIQRFRSSPYEVERAVARCARQDGDGVQIFMEQEPGASGKSVIDHFRRQVVPGYQFRSRPASGPKSERIRILAAAAEGGNLILREADWNPAFLDEAAAYRGTGSQHDDQLDAAAYAVIRLGRSQRGWSV